MKLARLPNGSPEIFRTLQGEGTSTGCPALFLRLTLCNLHCSWCDTPFTWNWEGTPWAHRDSQKFAKKDHLIELSQPEILSLLQQQRREGDRLVITGGEPLLQQEELVPLLHEAASLFSGIEVETNGTQLPIPALRPLISQFNVSPKLKNSGNSEALCIKEDALQFFSRHEEAYFKFVVSSEQDLAEIQDLQKQFQIPHNRILLMPEGRTPAALAKNRSWLAGACLEHSYRLCDRLHVQLWGDERGR